MSERQMAGVPCMTVHSESRIASIKRAGSLTVLRGAITSMPPEISGRISSRTAMSKESVVTAKRTSEEEKPGSFCMERRKFTTAG
jgi:hypothetical protein